MLKRILRWGDKLEDRVRARLSKYPIWYALIAGVGVVSFWRGVWEISDILSLHPVVSLIIGIVGLLLTGVFVSSFIGTRLIISGLKGDKKEEEKTIDELSEKEQILNKISKKLDHLETEIEEIKTQQK